METIVLNVSHKRMWIFNGIWVGTYIMDGIIAEFLFPVPIVYLLGLLAIFFLFDYVLHRAMWVITEVSIEEERIRLICYQLWIKKSIEIQRQSLVKIQVKERANTLMIVLYDDRFIRPRMRIKFSKWEFDKTCDSKADVEAVIKLFEKYNYHIEKI